MAKETAEQKLLKALQKKSVSTATSAAKQSLGGKKLKISFSLFDINKILLVGVIVCILILVFQLRSGISLINKKLDFSTDIKNQPKRINVGLPRINSAKFYIDSFGNRNIFKPYDIALGKAAAGQPNLSKRLTKYKLVGVAWLDLPESASIMIEDAQTKTTYFLKTGEQLEGVTVKTIYTDRVILSYENEETTIKL